jgi:hypothetical protein
MLERKRQRNKLLDSTRKEKERVATTSDLKHKARSNFFLNPNFYSTVRKCDTEAVACKWVMS